MTDFAQRVEDVNVNRATSVAVHQKLTYLVSFVTVGAIHTATLNMEVVFEDFGDRLTVCIPQMIWCSNVMCAGIDEEAYRELE